LIISASNALVEKMDAKSGMTERTVKGGDLPAFLMGKAIN